MADRSLVIDLRQPVRVADLPDLAGRFLAWWGGELRALLPWRTATPVGTGKRQTTLVVRRGRWFLQAPGHPAVVLDSAGSDAEAADQILHAEGGVGLSTLRLLVPRDQTILRRVELPQVPESYLRESVGLQIDRLTPFKAEAVRYAYRIVERDAEHNRLVLEVAIVPLDRLAAIEQRVRALGLGISAIDVEGEDGEGCGYDLGELPSTGDLRRRRNLNLGLAAIAALVWLLAAYSWSHWGEAEITQWEAQIAELRPAAERGAASRRRTEAMIGRVGAANEHQPTLMLAILAELSRVLPDSATVLELTIDREGVRLSGLALQAPSLIGALERSPMFRDVRFLSPVIRKTGSSLETFEITLKLEGRVSS